MSQLILGGSPLGLVNITTDKNQKTGMSTLNGGSSRNINVDRYNKGKDVGKDGTKTMFTGVSDFRPYGNISGKKDDLTYSGVNNNILHNNSIYDTSIINIINQLSGTEAALRPSDFAYLRDLGVYPNNRLMIARRFISPHGDNIYIGKKSDKADIIPPLSVLISWKPQTEDFLEITFGEHWEDAKADFTEVLNSLGKDFGISGKLSAGDVGGALGNLIPLPGFTETLQRKVLEKIGIFDENQGNKDLPSGNPNLIKEAKRRKTIDYSTPGSGLKCSVSVKMTCEFEQKFISGIDPTIAWQNIIANILTFGTGRSDIYGLSTSAKNMLEKWSSNPDTIIKDMIQFITDGIEAVKIEFTDKINSVEEALTEKTSEQSLKEKKEKEIGILTQLGDDIKKAASKSISKYKIEIVGIANALSGNPSTPWHITIGNPMRPVFCAGDMFMDSEVSIKLGPTLAFNDLPSNITAEFTLKNARPWGLQEIMAKFNAGYLRVSNGPKDSNSLIYGEKLGAVKNDLNEKKSDVKVNSTTVASAPNKITNDVVQKREIIQPLNNTLTAASTTEVITLPKNNTPTTKFGRGPEEIVSDPHNSILTTLQNQTPLS